MKLKNGQKVSYEIDGIRYPGTIKDENSESIPYELIFDKKPIIGGVIVESLLIHKSNVGKIIGINIFKNE